MLYAELDTMEQSVMDQTNFAAHYKLLKAHEDYVRSDLQKTINQLRAKGLLCQIGDDMYAFTDKGQACFQTKDV